MCSIAKVLGIFHTEIIPATINTEPIDMSIPGIRDEKLLVSKLPRKESALIPKNFFTGCN